MSFPRRPLKKNKNPTDSQVTDVVECVTVLVVGTGAQEPVLLFVLFTRLHASISSHFTPWLKKTLLRSLTRLHFIGLHGSVKVVGRVFWLAIHHISMDLRNPHVRAADKALNLWGNPITKLSSNVFVMKASEGA